MRKKFKIMYPQDHPDESKRGKPYKCSKDSMIIMNQSGVFFLFSSDSYYPSIKPLSQAIEKYDVVWAD